MVCYYYKYKSFCDNLDKKKNRNISAAYLFIIFYPHLYPEKQLQNRRGWMALEKSHITLKPTTFVR